MLTLREFLEDIEGLPLDTPFLAEGSEATLPATYRRAGWQVVSVLHNGEQWSEDFGEEKTPESVYGARRQAVLVP